MAMANDEQWLWQMNFIANDEHADENMKETTTEK